ncbi:MAG: hypothetical protein AAF624_00575 [Bacteroidota bacterium]
MPDTSPRDALAEALALAYLRGHLRRFDASPSPAVHRRARQMRHAFRRDADALLARLWSLYATSRDATGGYVCDDEAQYTARPLA